MDRHAGDAGTQLDWRCGRNLLQLSQRRLLRDGVPVGVEERAFDLIALLVQHHDRALDRREITDALWGPRPVSDNTLRQVLYKARRALGDDGEQQNVIRTLHGRSLQWVAPLEAVPVVVRLPVAAPIAEPAIGARHVSSKRRHWFAAATAIILSIIAVVLWMPRAQAPANSVALPRLAIEPIDNATGDATLDWVSNGLPGLLASLIGSSGGVSVVDPLQTTRAWHFKPTQGRTPEQQLRFVTGADVLVGGSLRKLGEKIYELRLHIIPAEGTPSEVTLTGDKPGLLAVNAVARVRRALHLQHATRPTQVPRDAFAAEAYARGVDMAAHGNWVEARTHFKVCVENVPEFLPAYVRLGQAQYRSNQMSEGEQTLQTALKLALQEKDNDIAAQALMDMGDLESQRQQNVAALQLMQQAAVYAQRSGDFHLQAENTLQMAETNSALLHLKQAQAQLSEASQWIAVHDLHGLRTTLFTAQRELANHSGDKVAEEAASQALLAENEANGNQHAAVGSLLSLARVKLERAEFDGAASLLQYAYTQAAAYDDAFLTVATADYLGITLLDLGVEERVDPIAD
ncbi:MAG: winged helix-turn-helix domain-containing protein, partial [Rudaea sp.]